MAIDKQCKSVCMTYNEPTIYYEYVMELGKACEASNIRFILKTNAYCNEEPWKEICKVVDAMNIDWKGTPAQCEAIAGVKNSDTKARIKDAVEAGVHVEVSIPLYHGLLDDAKELYDFGSFLNTVNYHRIPIHLLKIFPAFKYEDQTSTTQNEIDIARYILANHIPWPHINIY